MILGAGFVGGTTGVLGAAHGPKLYQKRSLVLENLRNGTPKPEAVENGKKFLREMYGVDVIFGDRWEFENSSAEDLDAADATQAIQILIEEMGKYPADFFSRNKIQTLRIGKNMQIGSPFNASGVGGYAEGKLRHVSLDYDPSHSNFYRRSLHHEFMHVSDFWNNGEQSDLRWSQIHTGCTCTTEIRRIKHKGDAFAVQDRSFINAYGETNPGEERAEFASMMMVPRSHALFLKRLEKENERDRAALSRKYEAMKKDYFGLSGGSMNQAYWDAVIALAAEEDLDDQPDSYGYDGWFEGESYTFDTFFYDDIKK